MARTKKRPELVHCKVTQTANPRAPWRVSWPVEREGGKKVRVRKNFSTENKAWKFAEETETKINNHNARYGDIPPEAIRAFDFYRDEAAALTEAGANVPRIENLIIDALDAIREAHNAREKNAITVAEAVALFMEYKGSRVGSRQADNLKNHLKRFAGDYGTRPMRSITAMEIEKWLESLRSRKNPGKLKEPPLIGSIARNAYRASLHTFFKHGANESRGWCANNPVAAIEAEKIRTAEPKAYSPKDAGKIMQAALNLESPLLPALTLQMFCGLRPSESMSIDLSTIDLESKEFRVPGIQRSGEETKTGARIAPLLPVAKAWLAAQPRRSGFGYDGDRAGHSREMRRILAAAKVKGINDGARHSFISYRTAEIRDIARVADECGNSVQIINAHYRQIVTEAAAEKFFALRPEEPAANVTHIQEGRVSA
jgi:integrase